MSEKPKNEDPLAPLNDKEVIKNFSKGVLAARGINPEEYVIHVERKDEGKALAVLVFVIVFQLISVYAGWQFTFRSGLDSEYWWALYVAMQFLFYPFIFTLVRSDKIIEIVMYAIICVCVSGVLEFISWLANMIGL